MLPNAFRLATYAECELRAKRQTFIRTSTKRSFETPTFLSKSYKLAVLTVLALSLLKKRRTKYKFDGKCKCHRSVRSLPPFDFYTKFITKSWFVSGSRPTPERESLDRRWRSSLRNDLTGLVRHTQLHRIGHQNGNERAAFGKPSYAIERRHHRALSELSHRRKVEIYPTRSMIVTIDHNHDGQRMTDRLVSRATSFENVKWQW